MTKFYFIAVCVLAIMSCNTASKTTVGIHVEGASSAVKPQIITKDSTYEVALDSTGSAMIVMAEGLKADYAAVSLDRTMIPVYIEPGKSFELSVKFEGRKVMPTFTGEGSKKNEYLNSDIVVRSYPDFKVDEDAFIASLAEQENKSYENLDTLKFDDQFNQLEKKRLHYSIYASLPSYPSFHSYYSMDTSYKASERYYSELKSAVQEDEALLGMAAYEKTLTGFIYAYANKDMKEYDGLLSLKNRLGYVQNNITSPAIAEYLVDLIATGYVEKDGVDNLAEITPVYNAKVTNADMKAKFEELCGKWAKVAKGQPSPSFKYMDIDGKEVSLADLAGKYVYVDVWATWCGPCRGELPHLKTLEHKYKGKNIHFVSISCDRDKAAWEKMVKEEKLEGIQLHTGDDQSFMDAFMIRGIPRFILLDREGNIAAADMSRPSDPKTVTAFDALEGI